MRCDYHTHTTYSDGSFLSWMVSAAERAGLDAIGITDHCTISAREGPRRQRANMGFNLDVTYERRRSAIEAMRERRDIEIHDGVEMDFHPDDSGEIVAFLDEVGFDYAIGSVHELDGTNVHSEDHFAEQSAAARRSHVATYFDRLVTLVESELFDVAAHIDLVERNSALRGLATDEQYRQVAEAFADSRTVPELNAGRVRSEYGEVHPTPQFMERLLEEGVEFVCGTDSHEPKEIEPRKAELETFTATHDVETTTLSL
ncbi:histidinol-phosphatase [Halobacteriales archaeon SW_6_65_46]|nr:MAG: histidinol-phosphatase [Halobacteriales archaeon SW_6_65_46]